MSTKAIVGKSDAQNNKHVSDEAAGSKHPTSHAKLGPKIEIVPDMSGAKMIVQMIHCSVWASVAHNFLQLKEGGIYSMTNFTVKPNKEEYRVLKHDSFMPKFDGLTTFKRVSVKADGFVKYLLNLVDFDAIEPADNKYLIDVAGYVSSVCRTNHLKSGSTNLDFHLANHRGQSIRVTLWGNLEEVLVEKKTKQVGACPIVLASASPKIYNNKVYLSSTSSTVILNDADIPLIKALKDANSGAELKNPYTPIDLTRPVKGPRRDGMSPHAIVKAAGRVQPDKKDISSVNHAIGELIYPSTALVGCSTGSLMDTEDESADDHVGLLAAISNLIGTTHVMEIKSQSYYEYGTFESFTWWQLNPKEVCGDSVGSSTLDVLDGVQTHRLSRPVRASTVATPTNPLEPKRTKSTNYGAIALAWSLKTLMVATEISSKDVSGNTPQDDNTDRLAYADASLE
ncbi:replication protein A 70 kDa DNA-binding subunit C-like protein [Tanacetum coccineum]|uniref:Replication protein A 70 kDa DNA-binding subunit C-like protein n=1 Tax=Tanacetum coccineum TaxID=301880 RepID=A0ABQ5J0Z6_9ASTR